MTRLDEDTRPSNAQSTDSTQDPNEITSEGRAVTQRKARRRAWLVAAAAIPFMIVVVIGLRWVFTDVLVQVGFSPELAPSSATDSVVFEPSPTPTSAPDEGLPGAPLTVEIRNGNGIPGLGEKTAEYLEGNGFKVHFGGNADRLNYETSIIFVHSDRLVMAYSLATLLELPQSAVVESAPISDQSDIVVVLGLDYQLPGLPNEPEGKIVFTCQIYRDSQRNQICVMNADGSDQKRLTQADDADHFYPSVAPDGQSIVFSSNLSGDYEIYEMDFSGDLQRLTSMGESYAPEISPDGNYIVFTHTRTTHPGVWVMNRDGTNPHPLTDFERWGAWDPVWSPDGDEILFASDTRGAVELFTIHPDGSDLTQVTETNAIFGNERRIRGRNDWSPDGFMIASYIGQNWNWDLFMVDQNGENLKLLTRGGNSLAPSFSPDSQWITYTSYEHNPGVSWACEIYILRVDGSETRRLTDNGYCDWQPRWCP
jgi:TolB protein